MALRLPDPMLARADAIPRGRGWLFEPKLDGFRCLVWTHDRFRARSRRGRDMTTLLPELERDRCDDLDTETVEFKPGVDGPTTHMQIDPWANLIGYVRQWLTAVKEKYEAPDLWAEARAQTWFLVEVVPEGEDNSQFPPEEQAAIAEQIRELRELLIETQQLQADQIERMDARLDYVVEALPRTGRLDWKNIYGVTDHRPDLRPDPVARRDAVRRLENARKPSRPRRPSLPGGDPTIV